MFVLCASVVDISTHSLTRRLTGEVRIWIHNNHISTHSLTRRLTISPGNNNKVTSLFQLTASQGG